MTKGKSMNTKEFTEARRLQMFNVAMSFLNLGINRGQIVRRGDQRMILDNINALCNFTPEEYEQAKDILFDACGPDNSEPMDNFVVDAVVECGQKLALMAPNYRYTPSDEKDLWITLYKLLEIDSLYQEAVDNGYGDDR